MDAQYFHKLYIVTFLLSYKDVSSLLTFSASQKSNFILGILTNICDLIFNNLIYSMLF